MVTDFSAHECKSRERNDAVSGVYRVQECGGGTKEHFCKSNPVTAKKQVRKKKKILVKDEIRRLQLGAVIRGGRCFQQNSTWLNGGAEGDEGTDLLKCLITWKEICSDFCSEREGFKAAHIDKTLGA